MSQGVADPKDAEEPSSGPVFEANSETSGDSGAAGGSDPIRTLWERVVEQWEADEAHKAFIAMCSTLGRLDEAGARYREIRETDGERAESAQARIDQIVLMAMATLETTRSEPSDAPRRWVTGVGFLLAVILVAWALHLWLG